MTAGLVKNTAILIIFSLVSVACGGGRSHEQVQGHDTQQEALAVHVPSFNADSAYAFTKRQVQFGPRVPNTEAHHACGLWLTATLQGFADTVYTQQARVRAYNGNILNIKNIIGVFHPEKRNRILLCAHWDSRPYADWDPDPANHYRAIDGANDGAGSVGVLLEIARQLQQQRPGVGVDIILFDAEDYGTHRLDAGADQDTWALGSQHWSRNPHRHDYQASFGILLDMVGASNATFLKEGFSMMYAPNIVRKVWQEANRLGYSNYFIEREGNHITDDHYYINTIRKIPTINIIHTDNTTQHGFFPQWHTIDDNMDIIDKQTLYVVGHTVLSVLFQ